MEADDSANKKTSVSKSTMALIERKRQNAILLREGRLQNKEIPYVQTSSVRNSSDKCIAQEKRRKILSDSDDLFTDVKCRECNIDCNASYLFERFKENVCDECREKDKDQFKLITKTEAKNEFVLKDCDFEYREPPLMYATAPNPHSIGGVMKLYLQGQVYERACEVHGGDAGIDDAITQRTKNKEIAMERKMNKKLSELRKSSKPRQPKQVHVHEFDEEIYDSVSEQYSKCCISCNYIQKYEKL